MRKLVGTYSLGTHQVKLFVRDGTGGEFTTTGKSIFPEICVGVNYKHWPNVVNVLLHEAFEFQCAVMDLRFRRDFDWAQASDGYVFTFNHEQFSECTARVAWFVAESLPALATAFKKSKVKKAKKKKGRA